MLVLANASDVASVARVSVGSVLVRAVSADTRRRAAAIVSEGRFDVLEGAVGFDELGDLLEQGL